MKFTLRNKIPRLIFMGLVINNGVKIRREFIFPSRPINFLQDLIFIFRSKFNRHSINGNFEAGVYLSHLRVTKPNDKILAVGLGTGSTLISVVKLMDSGLGFYRCIEASETQIEIARKNVELNNIEYSRFEILNAVAGEIKESWGSESLLNININDYDFDVLELDCEGSELSIIQSLEKTPRNIIVELHPGHFPDEYKEFDVFIDLMKIKNYEYMFAYGHSGDYLDIHSAKNYYNSTKTSGKLYDCDEDRVDHYFVVCPIVVTFIYNPLT
jgi:SAM-dependent methyltransferase